MSTIKKLFTLCHSILLPPAAPVAVLRTSPGMSVYCGTGTTPAPAMDGRRLGHLMVAAGYGQDLKALARALVEIFGTLDNHGAVTWQHCEQDRAVDVVRESVDFTDPLEEQALIDENDDEDAYEDGLQARDDCIDWRRLSWVGMLNRELVALGSYLWWGSSLHVDLAYAQRNHIALGRAVPEGAVVAEEARTRPPSCGMDQALGG